VLRDYVQRAKAFVFAAEEDFGIVPVEAQACGTPVIAYGKGGALETVCGLNHVKPTGVLFHEQTVEALSAAVQEFEQETARITAENCRSNALRFSIDSFCSRYTKFVTDAMEESRRVVPLTYQEDILSVDF
jgi:glycosyltransferase involved in cell wall biosynthesis